MEEGNTIEHRDYLSMEEEKRKKARLVRMTVQGPLLRWISKSEEVKVVVEPPPAHSTTAALRPLAPRPPYGYAQTYPHYSNVSSDSTAGPSSYVHPSGSSSGSASADPPYFHPSVSSSAATSGAPSYFHPSGLAPGSGAAATPPYFHPSASSATHYYAGSPVSSHSQPAYTYQPYLPPLPPSPPREPEKQECIETVMKNYVVHEANQSEKSSRPSWLSTMKAMFGENVNWDELRVYVSKGRPYSTYPILSLRAPELIEHLVSSTNPDLSDYRQASPISRPKDQRTVCGRRGISRIDQGVGTRVCMERYSGLLHWPSGGRCTRYVIVLTNDAVARLCKRDPRSVQQLLGPSTRYQPKSKLADVYAVLRMRVGVCSERTISMTFLAMGPYMSTTHACPIELCLLHAIKRDRLQPQARRCTWADL